MSKRVRKNTNPEPVEAPVEKYEAAKMTTGEIGVSGVKISTGYVYEEFLPELQGHRGRKIYREMSDNDATVGALVTAVDSMLKATPWRVMPNPNDKDGFYADYVESLLEDMEYSWDEFISEVLTYIPFGFSVFEVILKRRMGFNPKNKNFFSKYNDGLIGIKKLAYRAQETIERWDVDEKGNINGFWQVPPYGIHGVSAGDIYIPMSRCLLFRTTTKKNNPEGRSVLRNAYRSYYLKKNIEIIEAIAIERELAGLPVISVPAEVLTNPEYVTVLNSYKKMARDLKFNEQGACIIPSDPWRDEMGKPINMPKVKIDLMSAAGTRAIDTNMVITRYDQNIARTVLADFLMLGHSNAGSFALSKSKTQLFLRSLEGFINNIAAVLNKDLLIDIWNLNGFPGEMMPELKPGQVAPVDLEELGNYISKLATAGLIFGGDPETEKVLRSAADLPEEVDSGNLDMELIEIMNPKPEPKPEGEKKKKDA
jgi:hypothetical protein